LENIPGKAAANEKMEEKRSTLRLNRRWLI
jgi:hypothetical protein